MVQGFFICDGFRIIERVFPFVKSFLEKKFLDIIKNGVIPYQTWKIK